MYILVHFVVLFVPGLLICLGLRVTRLADVVYLSFLFSLIKVTALIWLAKRLELTLPQTMVLWVALIAFVTGCMLLLSRQRAYSVRAMFAQKAPDLCGAAVLALATIAYFAVVGPYLEIPADVYAHLEYLQGAGVDLVDRDFSRGYPLAVFSGPGNETWYYLFAWIASTTSMSFAQAIGQATIANTVTLVLIVYVFAGVVFNRAGQMSRRRAMALVATVIFFLSFGTNIFAFVRYYALAPTTLNLALYFSVVAMLLRYLGSRGVPIFWVSLGAIAMLAAWLIHEQEAVFIFVVGLGVAIFASLRQQFFKRLDDNSESNINDDLPLDAHRSLSSSIVERGVVPWSLLAAVALIGLVSAMIWSHLSLPRYGVYDSKLISLQDFLPTSRDLYILNPARQFYETIALLGVVVYVLSLLFVKRIVAYPYLVVGLLLPLLTVFNPFFADMFLRHSRAESFWRFSFLVPVAFVAAVFLVSAWERIREGDGLARLLNGAIVVLILIALVAPARLGSVPTWTRWSSLQPIAVDNSPEYWQDLIDAVSNFERRTQLYTDPVTGYMLSGLTTAQSRRKKFHRYPYDELSLDYLSIDRLRDSTGSVLIVNQRDGSPSVNGTLSGHWPAQITKPSAYYRPELLDFIARHPEIFEQIWQADRVTMYRINGGSA